MRTLFAKILLWFWLAFAVMIGAQVLLESIDRQRGVPLGRPGGPFGIGAGPRRAMPPGGRGGPFAIVADLANDAYQQEGRPGLERILARVERQTDIRAFCLDPSGAELRGRKVPPDVLRTAGAVARAGVGRFVDREGRMIVGYPLAGEAWPVLVLMVERPGPSRTMFLPHDLWLRMVLLLSVGALGCYLLALYLTAPVKRLRRATRRLADGDLSARVGSGARRRRDELEDLGRDFDRMAERVESVVSVQRRLLTDISHELRSPLARMNVAIGILRQRQFEDSGGMLGRLETEAGRLNRLIGDLLTLSRLESGDGQTRRVTVDLVELVTEVAADAQFEAGTRGCSVRLVRMDSAAVEGEPELLHGAVENVVRNAVRHTADGTAVEITLVRDSSLGPEQAVIQVRDHGPGVPDEHLERIFLPFHRVDDVRERRTGGAGLGLAIARRTVVQHGGRIDARSAEGGGLRVSIALPVAEVPASPTGASSGAIGSARASAEPPLA